MSLVVINDFLLLIRRYEEMAEWLRLQQDAARDKEAFAELERACQQEVGLPLSIVQRSSPEDIRTLLGQGINPEGRSLVLAELLVVESLLHERAGDVSGYMRASLQSFCLLGDQMSSLPKEARENARVKLDDLAKRLKGVGDDPYVRQKLTHFGY